MVKGSTATTEAAPPPPPDPPERRYCCCPAHPFCIAYAVLGVLLAAGFVGFALMPLYTGGELIVKDYAMAGAGAFVLVTYLVLLFSSLLKCPLGHMVYMALSVLATLAVLGAAGFAAFLAFRFYNDDEPPLDNFDIAQQICEFDLAKISPDLPNDVVEANKKKIIEEASCKARVLVAGGGFLGAALILIGIIIGFEVLVCADYKYCKDAKEG